MPDVYTFNQKAHWLLLAALDLGWQVEEPVYIRPRPAEVDRWESDRA
jgi:hypothetical protein